MGLLLWESPGLGLGLGFSFWEQDTWDIQQEGLGSSQTSAWAVTDIIPQAWGDQCPTAKGKGEARQLLLWGQQGPSPPGICNCFWVSFPSCAKCGQCSTALRRDVWPIEIYKLNSATLFTLWVGEWVLEQPEQHPKARNKGELPATSPSKLSSKGKLAWGACSRPTT